MVAECNGLILPSKLVEKRFYDKEELTKRFNLELERFINNHQHVKEPYFILIKANPDNSDPKLIRQAMSFYEKRPPFITRTLVFWVDNSRGLSTWLWRVQADKEIIFNKSFATACKDILRVKESPS
ncbi:MAG: hypothetical protein ABFQ95_01060 [Pseudomonadota bacterium]